LDLRWQQRSKSERRWVESYLRWLENGQNPEQASEMMAGLQTANEKCGYLLDWVRTQARHYRNLGKTVAILGGDHSTPLGLMEVLGQDLDSFGILHIDAHMDLRNAYEGFDYSHASIMFNALRIPSLSRLVQVGIRDYCPAEKECAEQDHVGEPKTREEEYGPGGIGQAREFTEVSETGHAHHGSQRRDDDPFMHRAARVVVVEPELHA
jgi:arginase family enzyme